MNNLITKLTRNDIFDILKYGLTVEDRKAIQDNGEIILKSEPLDIRINIFGRLEEIEFLSRLYDLEDLPSTDSRFPTFKSDIFQHRYNNDDWEDYWFLTDDRLKLYEDKYLLNFICEIFHPYVRDEKSNWQYFLDEINNLLKIDGYELYETSRISNRIVYSWKKIESVEITRENNIIYNLKQIGNGSYANVYKYKDEYYNRFFVIKKAKKELDEKELERFKREYDELNKMRSPHVVEVYCYNEQECSYTMECMDCTLLDYIGKYNNKLTLRERILLSNQLFKTFNYTSTKKVLHRDISFTNILLKFYDEIPVLKIADFGLVKVNDSDLTSRYSTIKGSLNDPDLIKCGFENYSVQHEIYALSRVIYYIMTGKRVLDKSDNKNLIDFMNVGLHQDLSIRFKTITEMQTAFTRVVAEMQK